MKIKSVIITFFSCFLLAMPLAAQAPQEVTLTVSSDGSTKEEATKNALRSAIEQAYGVFVSANTTILNDELVKDEIVTVSNGSIKDYKEISAIEVANGNYFVSLSATVSLPHLITYAKNHGSECEFAGNTFAINERIRDMQYRNVEKVLDNLRETIMHTKPMFDYNLKLDEPELRDDKYLIRGTIYIMGNGNTLSSILLINNTIKELCKQIDPVGGYEWIDAPYVISMPKLDRNTWSFQRRQEEWFNGRELLKKLAADFQLHDNISTPSNLKVLYGVTGVYKNPLDAMRGIFHLGDDGIVLDGNRCGDIKKPYKQENFEKDCREAKKMLMSSIQRFINRGGFPDLTFDPNIDFPVNYSVVPDKEHKAWVIRMVFFYYPVKRLPITFEIPKEDIGKYSKFWVEPKL